MIETPHESGSFRRGRCVYHLTGILLVALSLRLAWFVFVTRNGAVESAALDYMTNAQLLINRVAGDPAAETAPVTSLFSALIAVGEFLTLGTVSLPGVARLISVGLGALFVLPVFYLAHSSHGRQAALIAAWAVAIHPLLITVSTAALAVSTYLTLLFTGAWCTFRAQYSNRLTISSTSGAFFALATLTVPAGLFSTSIVLFVCAVIAGRLGTGNTRRTAICFVTYAAMLVFGAAFLGFAPPWTLSAEATEAAGPTLRGLLAATHAFGPLLLVPLAAFGLPGATGDPAARNVLFALFVAGVVALVVDWAEGQALIMLLPVLLIWAAAGTVRLSSWFPRTFAHAEVLPLFGGAVLSIALLSAIVVVSYQNVGAVPAVIETGRFAEAIDRAGRWLTWVDPADKRVMDTSRNIAYYGGASFVPFPNTDGPRAIAAIETASIDFIIVRSTSIEDRAYLREWFERGIPDRRARLIHTEQTGRHQMVVIYRWAQTAEQVGQSGFTVSPANVTTKHANDANSLAGPLKVSGQNSRYFSDGSRVIYLTGFHTWANLQDGDRFDPPDRFDFAQYLSYLKRYRHNFIRLWTMEHANRLPWRPYDFRIEPTPYLRSGPGLALDGKPKFDVRRFNEAYFHRLRERVQLAGQHGMYVSVMLFNGWSVEKKGRRLEDPWRGHPFHRENNVNALDGDANRTGAGTDVHALRDPRVLEAQEAYVTRVVEAVNEFDNVLFEICNECQDRSVEWQYHMIRFVRQLESRRQKQHPVGMTAIYPTGRHADLERSPADWISPTINVGYENAPPVANGTKVIITDTDHLFGLGGDRAWVWKSFTAGLNPIFMDAYDYAWAYPDGGNKDDARWEDIRRNLGYTADYAARLDLGTTAPRPELSSSGFCLARTDGKTPAYLAYSPNGAPITLDLTESQTGMTIEWFDPKRGLAQPGTEVVGGSKLIFEPPFAGDAVLYVTKRQK